VKLLRYEEREFHGIKYHLRTYGHRDGDNCYSIFYELPDSPVKGLRNCVYAASKDCGVSASVLHQQRKDGVIERIAIKSFGWIGSSISGHVHHGEYYRGECRDELLLESIGEENRESLLRPKCFAQKQEEAFARLAVERGDLRKVEMAVQNARKPWSANSNPPIQREEHEQKMTM
jgi:hypothetical protein